MGSSVETTTLSLCMMSTLSLYSSFFVLGPDCRGCAGSEGGGGKGSWGEEGAAGGWGAGLGGLGACCCEKKKKKGKRIRRWNNQKERQGSAHSGRRGVPEGVVRPRNNGGLGSHLGKRRGRSGSCLGLLEKKSRKRKIGRRKNRKKVRT